MSLGRFAGAHVIGEICGGSCQSLGRFAGARVSRWEDLRVFVSVVGKNFGTHVVGRFAGAPNAWH